MEKRYDFESRAEQFAQDCRDFVRKIIDQKIYESDAKQLLRSSGSITANYIEGNDALGDRDRLMKYRTSRRESKESRLWLRLLKVEGHEAIEVGQEKKRLLKEAHELMLILSAIIRKLDS